MPQNSPTVCPVCCGTWVVLESTIPATLPSFFSGLASSLNSLLWLQHGHWLEPPLPGIQAVAQSSLPSHAWACLFTPEPAPPHTHICFILPGIYNAHAPNFQTSPILKERPSSKAICFLKLFLIHKGTAHTIVLNSGCLFTWRDGKNSVLLNEFWILKSPQLMHNEGLLHVSTYVEGTDIFIYLSWSLQKS